MFSENAFSVIRLILRSAFVIAALVSFAFPQTAVREKPKVKDFGKSLIKKKKSKPEDKKTADEISSGEEVIKVETNLVRSDVLVLDQKGRFILGLNKGDFIVTEKNVPQVVETFSLGDSAEIPRSIVLIIDYSGSQKPYIKTSVEAAKNLVDKLNPRDRMAIVPDDVKLLADFTNDKEFLKKKLDSLKNKNGYGKSLQYSALMATLNELFDAEDIRPMIIFQTDGDQSSFIARDEQSDKQLSAYYGADFTVEAMFNSIYKSRATIYSVVSGFSLLGLTPDEQLEKAASFTPFKKIVLRL
ncbi:MAG: VWA domain-containing protein [Pyrinomonadaceae bacterium]